MKRRSVVKGGLAIMGLPLLSRIASAQDQKPVVFWMEAANPQNQQAVQSVLVDGFNAAHPEYNLSVEYRGADLDRDLRLALLSGGGPDIVLTGGPSTAASDAAAGQLLDLSAYAEKLGWNERILPFFLDLGKVNGKLFSLAKTSEGLGMFYNKTQFDKNGWSVPKNNDELEKLADEMLAKGITPFGAGNATSREQNTIFLSIVLNAIAGPDNLYKALSGDIPWTDPSILAAITKMKEWWDKKYYGDNYFSLSPEQGFARVATGEAGMCPTGMFAFEWVNSYYPPNNAEPGYVPWPSLNGPPVYSLGIGSTVSINAHSQNLDGSAALIDYIFTPEFYSKMESAWTGQWNIPLKDTSSVHLTNVIPLYEQVVKEMDAAVAANNYGYATFTFWPPATYTYVWQGIEEVWLGTKTPLEYLTKVDQMFAQEKSEGRTTPPPPRA